MEKLLERLVISPQSTVHQAHRTAELLASLAPDVAPDVAPSAAASSRRGAIVAVTPAVKPMPPSSSGADALRLNGSEAAEEEGEGGNVGQDVDLTIPAASSSSSSSRDGSPPSPPPAAPSVYVNPPVGSEREAEGVWGHQRAALAKALVSIHIHSQGVYQTLGLIEPGSTLPTSKILDLVQV